MKRLLLVMGMVGCGGGDTSPESSQTKVDGPPVQTADFSEVGKRLDGLEYVGNSKTPFTGVAVDKHENGQQSVEITYKDGKLEGPVTGWYENGKKRRQRTYKDAKKVSETW